MSGFKLRVSRWEPSTNAQVHQVAFSSATSERTKHRSGRTVPSRKIPSAVCTTSVSNGLIKERAYFVAEFLAAQARPSGVPQKSRGQQQLLRGTDDIVMVH